MLGECSGELIIAELLGAFRNVGLYKRTKKEREKCRVVLSKLYPWHIFCKNINKNKWKKTG